VTRRFTLSSLTGLRFQTGTKGFPSGGKEPPSRSHTFSRVTVIMNITGHEVKHWLEAEAQWFAEPNLDRVHSFHNRT
jgi:hypothetical protein